MAHEWVTLPPGPTDISTYGKRQCRKCGVVQRKWAEQDWMRVIGYRWEPLAGKCTMLKRTMPDLREVVIKELHERGWSAYQLVQSLKGKRSNGKDVPAATVYEFVRGKTTINSEYLGLIFDVLRLDIKRKK
jgi:hypothetical protein